MDFYGLAGACYCVADYSFWSFAVAHRQFFRTVYVDSKTESLLRGEFDSLTPGGIASLGERIPNVRTSLVTVYIHRMLEVRNSRPHVERLLADFEIAADKDLAISKTLTKMGPMLGLWGH